MKSWLVAAVVVTLGAFGAAAQQPIVITVGGAAGNPGDTAELEVALAPGGTAPATLILFLEYAAGVLEPDTDFYSVVQTDLGGNTVVTRSAVQAGPAVVAAGKTLVLEVPSPGRLGVAITGINEATLPDGLLFSLALRIANSATPGTDVVVQGAPDSSATTDGANDIPLVFVDGLVTVGCTAPPAPGGVSASTGLDTGVRVAWTPVAGPAAEYMVYRANSADLDRAVPVSGWLADTAFLDETANPPQPVGPDGCCLPGQRTVFEHYYWVRARTAEGCQSAFAGPSAGHRGDAKAHAPAAAGGAGVACFMVVLGTTLVRRRTARRRS